MRNFQRAKLKQRKNSKLLLKQIRRVTQSVELNREKQNNERQENSWLHKFLVQLSIRGIFVHLLLISQFFRRNSSAIRANRIWLSVLNNTILPPVNKKRIMKQFYNSRKKTILSQFTMRKATRIASSKVQSLCYPAKEVGRPKFLNKVPDSFV